jgi:ABC-type polysaccharide/polyol phosphate transport system ATPase subunit
MPSPRIVFDHVWKQFVRGERHDSLRDLIPAIFSRSLRRRQRDEQAFWAVQDVTFEVAAGEALGIIGRNGAGKSTILKLLNRILKPTRGSCHVIGRTGALIEIAAGFHQDLTGRENVYLQGAIMGMRRAEIAARFDEIVEFAGIERFVDTPVKRYSSGMNARLGFSIAAHLNPDVLLIDEVLAVGDMAFQTKCQERMKRFKREGVAIVFVSHHLPVVASLCDRVLLVECGAAVCMGSAAAVIADYCSRGATPDQGSVLIDAALRGPGGVASGAMIEVPPGARLLLDVTVAFRVALDNCTVAFAVRDVARDFYVYGTSCDQVGVPPFSTRPGDVRHFRFAFQANLTRGVFGIELAVEDHDRHQFAALVRGACHFQVVENVSYDGIANLYLTARELPSDEAVTEARPALAR